MTYVFALGGGDGAGSSARPARAARGLPRRPARRLVLAWPGSRPTSSPTSTSSSCWPRPPPATRRCWARRSRCSSTHFWEEHYGALVGRALARLEPGRGLPRRQRQHARRRGDDRDRDPSCGWSARERITRLLTGGVRVIEHYDPIWRPLPHYNRERARASVPAVRRDARALVRVGAAGAHARRFEEEARRLFPRRDPRRLGRRAGSSTPSTSTGARSCAAAALGAVRGDRAPPRCSGETRLRARVVGARGAVTSSTARTAPGGTSSTSENRPASTVWDGKPDVYHALGAIAPACDVTGTSPSGRASQRVEAFGRAVDRLVEHRPAAGSSPPP